MSCVPEFLTAYVEEKACSAGNTSKFRSQMVRICAIFRFLETRVIFRLQNLFKGMSLTII